ncbi:hypothetical protein C0992_004468 [Termitomyces sp. T32_za158]|nr:hypothetical protein C0992_004468 [Termitomyces sp. T32_za158]
MCADASKKVDRFQEPGSHGLLCDLLWADPISNYDELDPAKLPREAFVHNDTRGCSYYFT